jgi:hypothetical protein
VSTGNALVVVNIILAAAIVWFSWLNYRRTGWFLYGVFALVWLAWAAVYTFVLVTEPGKYDSVWFGMTFIRPLNVTTFGLVLLIQWYRWRNDHR